MNKINSEVIRKKALNLFPQVLISIITEDSSYFPKIISGNKGSFLDIDIQRELINESKIKKDFGYDIIFIDKNIRGEGKQSIIDKVIFSSLKDYVVFLNKEIEIEKFNLNFNLILNRFPQLKLWIEKNPNKIISNENIWIDLIKVCDYFVNNPKPNLYIRELPIEIDTKFIENNESILRELLDILIYDYINKEEQNFKKRFNLKYTQPLIRIRILDKQILEKSKISSDFLDLCLPLNSFRNLNLDVEKIFIVENLMNFLTFPYIKKSIVIFGSGYSVNNLKETMWLENKNIYYWGDIDSHGFAILSGFREKYPQIKSIFMNLETLDNFKKYIVEDKKTINDTYSNLTDNEKEIFKLIRINNSRLEQEKIPHKYIEENLEKMFTN